ncbi:DUF3526 domain-containing protein [Caulobacter sp.]|uniref:DUF3526 domain-containing protein n=1 Tax=Caulobacter sp. TaxID=78 RepID=UPI00160F57D6
MIALIGLELAILRRDRRAFGSLVALGLLILVAFFANAAANLQADQAKAQVAAAERARWVGQGEKDPHSAAHYSIFAFKPSPALAALDPGAEPFVGQSVWLEAHHQNDMLYRPQQNASALQRAAFANPAALLTGFAPLVVFLLAFTLVAQDRERGGLRLALGAATAPARLVVARAAAVWSAAGVTLIAPVALAAVAWTAAQGRLDADVMLRLLSWTVIIATYLAVVALAAVLVCLKAASPRLALAALFGAWIAFALVAPRVLDGAAGALAPLPSTQSVKQEIARQAPAFWSDEQNAKNRKALMARYGVDRYEDIPNPRMAELDLMERHSHAVFDRVLGDFYRQVATQDDLFARLSLASPAAAAQALSAAAAGSDFSHHRHFIDSAERYRRDLVNAMNADGMAHSAHGAERHLNDETLWSAIPPFAYAAPALGERSAVPLPALLALLAWLAAILAALQLTARSLKP